MPNGDRDLPLAEALLTTSGHRQISQSMTISDRVIDILARVCEADELLTDSEARLFERGYLDSLGTVELLLELSEEFGVTLSPTEVDRDLWATPSRIVSYMQHRVGV